MTQTTETTRILIIDDHALFRDSIARLLAAEPDFEIVGRCASLDEAEPLLTSRQPHLVLLDLDLGKEQGSDFFRRFQDIHFPGRVLVVAGGITDQEASNVIRQGAAGIFLKHDSPELLVKSIRKVIGGELWLDQRYLQLMLRDLSRKSQPKPRFTDRERQALRGVMEGLANKEIGAQLGISETAVKAALQQLFNKTGVRTRSQLVRIVLENYRDEL